MLSRVFRTVAVLAAAVVMPGLPAARAFAQEQKTVTIELTAAGSAFDRGTIRVPAGARVIIAFENRDRIPHNVSVYETQAAKKVLYYGEIINGFKTVRYEFTAPAQPGTYFLRCDLHPRTMVGDFVVE